MDLIPRSYSLDNRRRTCHPSNRIRGEQNKMEAIKISVTMLLISPLIVLVIDVVMEFLYSQVMKVFKRGEL